MPTGASNQALGEPTDISGSLPGIEGVGADVGAADVGQVEGLQSLLGSDLTPEERTELQARIALAVRRRMAGVV
jgi:hypothetical protein